MSTPLPIGITARTSNSGILTGFAVDRSWNRKRRQQHCETLEEAVSILEMFDKEIEEEKAVIQRELLANPIERVDGFAALRCKKGKDEFVYVFVDDDIYLLYRYHTIYLHIPTGYPRIYLDGKVQALHRVIMNAKPGQKVDHIKGGKDGKDRKLIATRENLRFVTAALNAHNKSVPQAKIDDGVPHIGVQRHRKSFKASITKDGFTHYVGTYTDMKVAAFARDAKAKQLWDENAALNDVELEDYEFDFETDRAVKKQKTVA